MTAEEESRIPDPKICLREGHFKQLAEHGVQMTRFCLICSVDTASAHREDRHEIMEWALDVASVSRDEAETLAEAAHLYPDVFLATYESDKKQQWAENLERAIALLLDVRHEIKNHNVEPVNLRKVEGAITSAIALLEDGR